MLTHRRRSGPIFLTDPRSFGKPMLWRVTCNDTTTCGPGPDSTPDAYGAPAGPPLRSGLASPRARRLALHFSGLRPARPFRAYRASPRRRARWTAPAPTRRQTPTAPLRGLRCAPGWHRLAPGALRCTDFRPSACSGLRPRSRFAPDLAFSPSARPSGQPGPLSAPARFARFGPPALIGACVERVRACRRAS